MNGDANRTPTLAARERSAARGPTVGEALVGLLAEHGIDAAFGIPGVHTVELYRGLAGSGIRTLTPRHEQGAAFMADGYAVATGKPALCVLISGPGVTNALTGVAQAFHDSRPMLVVASTVESSDLGRGRGPLHDLPDQSGLMAGVCGLSETVLDPERLPELLRDAFDLFDAGRPRPVHLAIPIDVLAAPAPRLERLPPRPARGRLERTALGAVASKIASAERPLLLLGGGGIDAGPHVAAFAERAGLPVLLTGNAKGAVPPEHPLFVGATLCTAAAADALADADLVVAVGTELSTVELGGRPRALEIRGELIRVDIDPDQVHSGFSPSIGIAADASEVLVALTERLAPGPAPADALKRARRLRDSVRAELAGDPLSRWVDAVSDALPEDAVVAVDSAQLAYSVHESMEPSRPRSWLAPYGFGTLGPALPMALGAKTACPERPVVAIAGDGGALFTISELATAVQDDLPVTYVIWNNSSYEQIRDAMEAADCPPLGTALTRVDFGALAEGMGGRALTAGSPDELNRTLAAAVASGRTTVIDVAAP